MSKIDEQSTGDDQGDKLPAPANGTGGELAKLWEHADSLSVDDPEAVRERILASVLNANSVADLLNAGSAVPAEQVYDVPLEFERIRASESDFNDGPSRYLHVEARILSNGDAITISCGAADVVVKLLAADMRGWLPFRGVIQRSTKQTKDGYYPVFLRPIDQDDNPF